MEGVVDGGENEKGSHGGMVKTGSAADVKDESIRVRVMHREKESGRKTAERGVEWWCENGCGGCVRHA